MKFKIKRNYRTKTVELVVSTGKGEELDYAHAELLHNSAFRSFLPLNYAKKHNGYSLVYQASGCISLEALQKRTIDPGQFKEILVSLLALLKACEDRNLLLQRVLFSPDRVFFHKEYATLLFAYVPVKSYTSSDDSFQSCVAYVCEHLQLASSFDQANARKVYAYAMKAPLASSVDYEKVLRDVGVLDSSYEEGATAREDIAPTGSFEEYGGHGWSFMDERQERVERFSEDCRSGAFSIRRESTGELWPLREGESSMGRHPANDIVVHGAPLVSREHVLLIVEDERLVLRDRDSSNGTMVRGVRLSPGKSALLRVGDVFVLGDERFVVR